MNTGSTIRSLSANILSRAAYKHATTAFDTSLTSTIQLQHRAFSTSVKCTDSRMQARSELPRRSRFIDRDDDSVDDSSPDTAAIRPARSLTHVNHDGEAHMVDVGSKNASKRVAIAVATIRFSNLTPYDQVLNNSNKKGDVLGVARIAGVMAAKRTSDMIPLCHPIMITKATVSLTLMAPVKELPHGSIHVEARVDCVGPTGVEMEALTAATTAALTIYDMCKVVDKDMVIQGSRVVMKTGGKSGTHISDEWLATKNREYFESARLDVPEDVRSCSMRT